VVGGEDLVAAALAGNGFGKQRGGKAGDPIHSAEEVIIEGEEDLVEKTGTFPEAVTAIGDLMGGITLGEVSPRGSGAELPKDAIKDWPWIDGRATSQLSRMVGFVNYSSTKAFKHL